MIGEAAGQHSLPVIAPPADRRLTQRLIEVWLRSARGRFPRWEDMRRVDLGPDWNWVFVVDLKQSAEFPHFTYLGAELARLADIHLPTQSPFTMSLLDEATALVDLAVASGAPRQSASELTLGDGRRVLLRSMAAPLAEDGETIIAVVGCAFGRIAEGAEETARPEGETLMVNARY